MIAAIENAILARLRSAGEAGVLGYKYHTLATYPEDWSEYLAQEAGGIRAPAAWVVFAGWSDSPDREGSLPPFRRAQFGLVVMAENLRNEQATRHGHGSEPGSYQLVEDAAALLAGQTLGLEDDIQPLKIGALRFVTNATALLQRKCSMLALELVTEIRIAPSPMLEGELDPFETFHSNWDVPAFGGIDAAPGTPGIQLPDDAHADATDSQQMEQD